jgi:hypothetical protein
MDSEFRPLSAPERELLEKLLEPEFAGRDELRSQLSAVTAKQVIEDGTLLLQCGPSRPFPRKHRLAVEGVCRAADGKEIAVLLHVDRHGFMNMLEKLKYDQTPIINPPTAGNLTVLRES